MYPAPYGPSDQPPANGWGIEAYPPWFNPYDPNSPYFHLRPKELTYREDLPIPPGYRVAKRPITPLMVTGAALFLSAWGLSAVIGSGVAADGDEEYGLLAIPLAGPSAAIGAAELDVDDGDDGTIIYILIVDTIAQAAGLTLFTIGAVARRRYLERVGEQVESPPGPVVTFQVRGDGIGLIGTF